MSLVPESDFYVTTAVYNSCSTPQLYNQIEKSGSGFNNVFYTLDETGGRAQEYSELENVDYSWGGGAPGSITDDVFYGEMNGWLEARFTETTTLVFYVDDSIRVWVGDEAGNWYNGGSPVIEEWGWNSLERFEYAFDTVAGHKYRIRIEYMDQGLGASCIMGWSSDSIIQETIPAKLMYAR